MFCRHVQPSNSLSCKEECLLHGLHFVTRLRPSVAHVALYTQWTPVACRKFSSGVFPPLVFRADRTALCVQLLSTLLGKKIDLGSCPESQAHFTACVENTPSLPFISATQSTLSVVCMIDTSVCSCLICENEVYSCN